jgi:hypothetical protein
VALCAVRCAVCGAGILEVGQSVNKVQVQAHVRHYSKFEFKIKFRCGCVLRAVAQFSL